MQMPGDRGQKSLSFSSSFNAVFVTFLTAVFRVSSDSYFQKKKKATQVQMRSYAA
jgi:hypothetical protein